MSITVNKVLYIGANIKLAKTLLSLNSSLVQFDLIHLLSTDNLEQVIAAEHYQYLISELPINAAVKARIAEKFTHLDCTYLDNSYLGNTCPANTSLESEVSSEVNMEEDSSKALLVSAEVEAALDCISIPIYYKNMQGKIIACNTYFSQVFGLLPENLINQTLESVLPNGLAKKVRPSKLSIFNDHQVDLLECEIRDVTGIKREFLIREEVADGSELQIGMLFDVSDMNAAKYEIEKERVMLRATADLSSDLIFFKDLESRFIGCNKQFEIFVGCSEADIVGKKDDQLFELNQARMCQAQDAQVIANDETYNNNEYLTYNNGEQHYIYMQKVPLKDKHGKVQGLVAIGRDITEKSLIKKQLELAMLVFENSRDCILVTDGTGVVDSVNDACVKISGYSKHELLDKKISSFAYGRDYRRLFVDIERGLKKEGKWQGNAVFHTKNGDLSYFWLEVYQIKQQGIKAENRVYSFTDLTKTKHNEEKIKYLSRHDSLTGLHNRIALFNHLEAAIARSAHKSTSIAVLFVEIKDFRLINERYGHNKGDWVLKTVAKRLQQCVSNRDIIARISDDQFVLVIEELDNEQVAALIAQKINQQLSEDLIIDDMPVNLSSSIGISISPDDGMDLNSILSNAESAMLRCKKDQSSTYHFYTNELTVHSAHQLELENELKKGFEEDQFEICYLPQYDLNKRQIVAVESLLRWNHPKQGVLSQSCFTILAEQSGLLIELGLRTFTKSAKQAAKWHQSGINFGRIAINISKLELSQVTLIGSIQQVLLDTGCEARWFEFEIDESLFSSTLPTLQENLLNLSRLGISLTVDGFGAERSVLYSIDKLNIEKFKISKHFIQGVPGYLAGEAMLKSLFVLAHSLGIDVVGDCIDSQSQDNAVCDKTLGNEKNHQPKEAMSATEATFYLRCYKRH